MIRCLSYIALLFPVVAASCLLSGCGNGTDVPDSKVASHTGGPARVPAALVFKDAATGSEPTTTLACSVVFDDVAERAAINFVYENGAEGRELMVESLGGGVAWHDYDADGLLDLYFTQGGRPNVSERSMEPSDVIYRQLDHGEFKAVGDEACIDSREYGMGVAVADYDNDGFDDIYVTNVGQNRLFRNCGDGTYEEVANVAGVDDDRWSTSAAWGDLDQDGDLDLYCCNYLQYDPLEPLECLKDGRPALCHPRQLDAWPDECFENLGDGTFARAASRWQLFGKGNKGLGVVIADLNNDGRPDIFVANDTTANFLFLGTETGQFVESALRIGGALSAEGAMQASMGIAIGDYDSSGSLDLFLTHFTGESNTLYQNLGESGLHDVSGATGIRQISNDYLGFGAVMHDFDQNGTQELLVANGHIDSQNADGAGYAQRACLMSSSNSKWLDVSKEGGDYFAEPMVGRGVATGDVDRDGDLDVVIVNQNQPAALLENVSTRGQWLKISLIGRLSNRSAIGTRVTVVDKARSWMQELSGGSSYCATHQNILIFGLGQSALSVDVDVLWPSGIRQQMSDVVCGQEIVLVEPDQPQS